MKFSHQHGPSALKIEMELPNDAHIYEVAEAFKKFLLCCGYEQGSIDEIMLGEQGPYIRVPVSGLIFTSAVSGTCLMQTIILTICLPGFTSDTSQ